MRSPAHDTALYLSVAEIVGSFGGVASWPIYINREPLSPADVVTIYDTGGAPGPLVDLRRPTVQVRIRSAKSSDGWQKANEIFAALSEPFNIASESVTILGWVPISEVAFIGYDDKDRALFTANFETLRDGAA